MRHHTSTQSREVIAPFQRADNTALRMTLGKLNKLSRDPRIICLDQAHLTNIVLSVGIKPGRDQNQLGSMSLESG